jgi:hypothetical protein
LTFAANFHAAIYTMKKIPELSHWMEQYQGNPDFYALLENYEKALEQLDTAKENKRAAKEAHQLAMESAELSEYDRLSLLTQFRRTKYLFMAEKAAFRLTKYALEHWIDEQTGGKRKAAGKKKK